MNRALVLTLTAMPLLLVPLEGHAYEFYQCGWYITGVDGDYCPLGEYDSDPCGCTVTAAPRWYGGVLQMKIENQGTADGRISAAQFVQAGAAAARAWNDVSCSSFAMDASQTIPANNDARWGSHNQPHDDEHAVFMVQGSNEWMAVTGSGAGATLGVTISPFYGSCSSREFADSDILMNGFGSSWDYDSILHTVMHEMGHSLGLNHPCLVGAGLGCNNACTAVMAASAGGYITPQQDDINGICALYPGTPGGLGAPCTQGCTSAPICVDYEGFEYCSHACPPTCETGYECKNVSGQNVCVRKSAPGVGDQCIGVCTSDAECIPDEGEPPDVIAHCHLKCQPGGAACPGSDRCVPLQDGGGVCFPPGSKQLGESCWEEAMDDCAPGLACWWDYQDFPEGQQASFICYTACDQNQPTSCGLTQLCKTIDHFLPDVPTYGACVPANGPEQNCEATFECVYGYACAPADLGDENTPYICRRGCDENNPASCGEGQECVSLRFTDGSTIGICYPAGNKGEGEPCFSYLECADGLLCVITGADGTSAQCLLECTPSLRDCPAGGQTCEALSDPSEGVCFPPGGTGPATDGGTVTDPDAGGRDDGGVVNPDGKDYLASCARDGECKYNTCRGVTGYGTICLYPCDPRLGHYDCPVTEDSGCVPNDIEGLNLGGQCQPGIVDGASLAVGAACDPATGYKQCTSGLCEQKQCLVPCNSGSCPDGFKCDTSEIEVPGVCRPSGGGGGLFGLGCLDCAAGASPEDLGPITGQLLLGGLLLLLVRRRRG